MIATVGIKSVAKMDNLFPCLLNCTLVDRAYPLIRDLLPGVTLERWKRFVEPYLSAQSTCWPSGLMTVQNAVGCILGFFCFSVRDDLNNGRVMFIDNIIVAEIPGHNTIINTITETIQTLANQNYCPVTHIDLTNGLNGTEKHQEWLKFALLTEGYIINGLHIVKRTPHNVRKFSLQKKI